MLNINVYITTVLQQKCGAWVQLRYSFHKGDHRMRSALAPPVGQLTEVQLLEAEMHFLSSHHWHPLVLAVQLAQSENR